MVCASEAPVVACPCVAASPLTAVTPAAASAFTDGRGTGLCAGASEPNSSSSPNRSPPASRRDPSGAEVFIQRLSTARLVGRTPSAAACHCCFTACTARRCSALRRWVVSQHRRERVEREKALTAGHEVAVSVLLGSGHASATGTRHAIVIYAPSVEPRPGDGRLCAQCAPR